jgi:hypothetical protein
VFTWEKILAKKDVEFFAFFSFFLSPTSTNRNARFESQSIVWHIFVSGFCRAAKSRFKQGCQIFHGTKYQSGEKYTKLLQSYQIPIKYIQWP